MNLSLYIHIPFCEVKCGYCDFYSVGRGFEDFDLQEEYVSELIREIDARAPAFSWRPIRSIFFGGGTPSLLDPRLLERIFSTLQGHFVWGPETEITLESNPKTVSLEKLRSFRSLGVNRLSIGVQSFEDKFLKIMGRIHNGAEARKTVDEARRAGFENVSIDMIFALPGQSFDDWKLDLEEALRLKTPHLSAYHLTIEAGTPFETIYRQGRLPAEEEGIRCLQWTRERLSTTRCQPPATQVPATCQAPMEPYEISNFSCPGFESVHNRNYWHYGEYLGFGTAAASFVKAKGPVFGRRQINVRDLKKYLGGNRAGFSEEINLPTAMGEFCMLGLRTREGIRKREFKQEFGKSLEEVYSPQISTRTSRGWLKTSEDGWRLTPEGILFSDEVAISFLP